MVCMQVGDKYAAELIVVATIAKKRHLYALAAVYQPLLIIQIAQ
jgi:hypothetical protein